METKTYRVIRRITYEEHFLVVAASIEGEVIPVEVEDE